MESWLYCDLLVVTAAQIKVMQLNLLMKFRFPLELFLGLLGCLTGINPLLPTCTGEPIEDSGPCLSAGTGYCD